MCRISCVCEINNFCYYFKQCYRYNWSHKCLLGFGPMHWPKNVGCLVGNLRARLSHCAKLWKLRKMAVSCGKRLCRPLPTFPIEMCKTIFDSLSENHMWLPISNSVVTIYVRKWMQWSGVGQVTDRDAAHRPSTRNATRVKKGGRNYTFCPILMRNRGRNTTFSTFLLKYRGQNTTFPSFLLKYRGRNTTNFPETWKRGVETEEHI